MKRRHIRTAVIALLVLLFAGTTLTQLEIEPAGPTGPKEPPTQSAFTTADTTEPTSSPPADTSAPTLPDPPTSPETQPETSPPGQDSPAAEEPSLQSPDTSPAEPIHICTVEIRCDTVVDTSKLENEAVIPYIPADGTILAETEVEFTPGETAFDVLKRATREHDIQLEFRSDNVYTGGINIEGIGYLYDFDGGPLSGWMYKVNEQFPNKGTNGFYVSDNDALVWVYTCDLGIDVGDNSIW